MQQPETPPVRMTSASFIEALSRIRDRFDWRLEPDAQRPDGDRREWTRFHLRAVADEGEFVEAIFDPISAVCYAATGLRPASWSEAAAVLGLDESDARALTEAANDQTWQDTERRRRPDPRLQALRVALIRAVEGPDQADPA